MLRLGVKNKKGNTLSKKYNKKSNLVSYENPLNLLLLFKRESWIATSDSNPGS